MPTNAEIEDSSPEYSVISFSYDEICSTTANLSHKLSLAFGKDALGLCVVTDIPVFIPYTSKEY
jgi:hypothetical protein